MGLIGDKFDPSIVKVTITINMISSRVKRLVSIMM